MAEAHVAVHVATRTEPTNARNMEERIVLFNATLVRPYSHYKDVRRRITSFSILESRVLARDIRGDVSGDTAVSQAGQVGAPGSGRSRTTAVQGH